MTGHLLLIPSILCLSVLAAAGAMAQTSAEKRLGKTDAQILALGYDAWMGLHGERMGDTTPAIAEGMKVYRTALRRRNDTRGSSLTPERREQIGRLRPLMEAYILDLAKLGSLHTDGGTIWVLHHGSSAIAIEETLYPLVGGRHPAVPARTTGAVGRALARLRAHSDTTLRGRAPSVVADSRRLDQRLTEQSDALIRIAARLPRKDSDRVLDFCIMQIEGLLPELGATVPRGEKK